ncbi:MotE family protein [Aquisalibacillus elongatus]|uniref:Flagellar motility protein MotE (MotC chaperone) n=1 Tax=Aquisalibacillus elongatus TaxID=485577 RepID=A0A3N5BES7_9BACI|nr:DUF489 family protein [Aquisalibacillus elongatus]RPF55993.1 flagellar motility protein MotE (MotC chaperone) [Aquisalibacillus elongatus]
MGDGMANINQETNKPNKLQWIFFTVIVPIIFAVTLAMVIATVMGVNPFQKAAEIGNQVPIVSSFIDEDSEEGESQEQEVDQEALLKDQEAEISSLESELSKKDETISDLEDEIDRLQSQMEQQQESNHEESLTKLTKSYSEMAPEAASDIIIEMERELALDLLINLPDDVRGNILSQMDSDTAAVFSNALMNRR